MRKRGREEERKWESEEVRKRGREKEEDRKRGREEEEGKEEVG